MALFESGELAVRVKELYRKMKSCTLCPRECRVNRLKGETGYCRSGFAPKVASRNAHHGEEPPISGSYGSGTIFFSNCTLKCVFCQNYPISQLGSGAQITVTALADMMLNLQKRKCHNINFVTPSHFSAQIVHALLIAVKKGFCLPLVYNTSGYEALPVLKLLDGIIDIYLPDMKYDDDEAAMKCSRAINYREVNRLAIKEMHRQVGFLQVDENEIAVRGVIIRHLVLPDGLAGSRAILKFIKEEIGAGTYISLMSQYFPAHEATDDPALGKRISRKEYNKIVEYLEELGLDNGWVQQM